MPSDNPTPSEYAILLILLAENREIPNVELKERFGVELSGAGSAKLNKLGYVVSRKVGRRLMHSLADAGWARCAEPMDFAGVRPKSVGVALELVMAALRRDLAATGRSLAMMLAPDAELAPSPVVASASSPAELTEQIRTIYKELAAEPGAWVNIADIRESLSSVERDDLDDALRQIEQERDVNIVPQANEKALSERTRLAAVIIGRQHKHFIAIGV
ncbi:hypothetical protein [Hamadaea tsunoensis]|uniref:hypothetical protein n=1 Tax=Hamadaea tsunoensis TaxID=53368 RepID=UPI000489F510|nr:hypothetical protein [Hamadaea tsunoensis]